MTRVLVVATGRKTRGGITSVVKAHETGEQWRTFHCHWVQTHRDGAAWHKIWYFATALVDFMVRLPFCDIVHIHLAAVNRKLLFVFLTKLFRKKLIIHLHFPAASTTLYDKRLSPRYGWCIRQADVCLVLSNTWKNLIGNYYKVNNLMVLYNPCPKVMRLPYSERDNYILFAGTVSPRKGNKDLVAAFAKVADKYKDWRVVIAGNGDIEEGKEQAKSLRIESQVEYVGWVSGKEKDEMFQKSAIYCLPSYAEGFPMSVLDAWAYGTPVVSTPVGGIPDVAVDGKNMMVFEPGDIQALADKLDLLLSDTSLRSRLAKASCDFADNVFNVKTICQRLGEIYNEVITME